MSTTSKDENIINLLLTRGVERVFPDENYLKERLLSGERLTIYTGIDPTAPTLHVGHSVFLLKLRHFQTLGHRVILLIGDFTATIGDPTGKLSTREMLTPEEIKENASLYKAQASRILDFEGDNPAEILYNAEWLSKMNLSDFMKIAGTTTVEQLIKRDMFQERQNADKPIFIHEFLYPLLQGYDSVAMEVDGEVGGNDQTFNMLLGRTLEKTYLNKEKFVIATKLLTDVVGKKMGKTEGNMVRLDDEAHEMFGKIMSWSDQMIIPAFELLTAVENDVIDKQRQAFEEGENPRDIKLELAEAITALHKGESDAKKAREDFIKTFSEGATPENIEERQVEKGTLLIDIAVDEGLVSSKSQYRRLLSGGAVKNYESGEKIEDENFIIKEPVVVRIGKKRFISLSVK